MPESVFHYRQAERNLKLVETLNLTPEKFWDWQVTALFYSALHLVNGHIRETDGGNYFTHVMVQNIIHHSNEGSKAKLPREVGVSYEKLQLLSRKARYLFDQTGKSIAQPNFVGADGFEKAVYAYELIYNHLKVVHEFSINPIQVNSLKSGWSNRKLPN
jgi:hypothetical protein